MIRTNACFGPSSSRSPSFVEKALAALRAGERFVAAADVVASATYLPDLVHHSLDLLIDGERGLWHLTNRGTISFGELAAHAARACTVPTDTLVRGSIADATPPCVIALATERTVHMPPLEDALIRYARTSAA
ncbi:hypothetical protein BH09MYX1_BH09MYX1_00460 [soil metagenome]